MIRLLTAAVLLAGNMSAGLAQVSLPVFNANFDDGVQGWTTDGPPEGISMDWDADVGMPDAGSLRVTATGIGLRFLPTRSQCIVPPEGTQSLTARARVFSDSTQGNCAIYILPNTDPNCEGEDFILGSSSPPRRVPDGWSETEGSFDHIFPSYRVALVTDALLGQCNFDDVRLVANGVAPPPAPDPVPVPTLSAFGVAILIGALSLVALFRRQQERRRT